MNLLDLIKGGHRLDDSYKLALYLETPGVTYSRDQEVRGPGYMIGGKLLPPPEYGETSGAVWMTFSGDIVWPGSSITARHAVIYNHRTKAILHAEDLGGTRSSANDRFTVALPGTVKPLVKIRLST
jgi:hypothetical protein